MEIRADRSTRGPDGWRFGLPIRRRARPGARSGARPGIFSVDPRPGRC